jgi:hypothetical protein
MNPLEMVVAIVAIVMVAGVVRGLLGIHPRNRRGPSFGASEAMPDIENERLREEVRVLKERVAVLERIATDGSNRLEQEIDRLRDLPGRVP